MRRATVVRAVVAMMLLVAVFGSIDTVRTERVASAFPDWRPYVEAVKTMALALTTVDYRTVDLDVQRILDNATGVFYDDFKGRSAEFTQAVLDGRSTSTSTIADARLDSHDSGQARVFVAMSTKTTNARPTNFTPASMAATDHGAEGGRGLQSVERGVPAVIAEC